MGSSGVLAGAIFVAVLISYTAQTELSEYIQAEKEYRQPFFLLYTVHSSYALVLLAHFTFFFFSKNVDGHTVLQKTRAAFTDQLEPRQDPLASTDSNRVVAWFSRVLGFPAWPFFKLASALAVAIATPALCWFVSVPFTSMVDITAIYNSSAFWAYIFAIWITKTDKLELKKACAVLLACTGVVIISYGGAEHSRNQAEQKGFGSKLLGDLLVLVGSITFAAYELFYEKYAALPSASLQPTEDDDDQVNDEEAAPDKSGGNKHGRRRSGRYTVSQSQRNSYAGVRSTDEEPPETEEVFQNGHKEEEDDDEETERLHEGGPRKTSLDIEEGHAGGDRDASEDEVEVEQFDTPPIYIDPETGKLDQQVFLLHANIITGSIGIVTFVFFAIPLPLLHLLGWETFRLPPDGMTTLAIFANMIAGMVFNAAFMTMISLAGPVMASVGALCTLVSVAIADVFLGGRPIEFASLVGSALIMFAFAMLAIDVLRGHRSSSGH